MTPVRVLLLAEPVLVFIYRLPVLLASSYEISSGRSYFSIGFQAE